MLSTLRMNLKLSAYELLEGHFDFNRSPLAPTCSKLDIHEKPQQMRYWEPHGNQAWYTRPELENYRCYRVCIPETRGERIADIVECFTAFSEISFESSANQSIRIAKELSIILKPPQSPEPFVKFSNHNMEAMSQLKAIFRQAVMPPQPTVTPKIQARVPLPASPMRVVPCTTPAPPHRVSTATHVTDTITLNNKPTGPALITHEEEETDT